MFESRQGQGGVVCDLMLGLGIETLVMAWTALYPLSHSSGTKVVRGRYSEAGYTHPQGILPT